MARGTSDSHRHRKSSTQTEASKSVSLNLLTADYQARNLLPSPEDIASYAETSAKIQAVLNTLTYREREIVKLRYGLGGEGTYTLEEVGRIFKVTRERIRGIETRAIQKLQERAELVGLDASDLLNIPSGIICDGGSILLMPKETAPALCESAM